MTQAVLITGAGGFVASHIAAGFAAAGYQVTAIDRVFDAPTRARLGGVRLVEVDLSACGADILSALPRPTVIIHGAALTTSPEALGITMAEHVAGNTLPLIAMLRYAAGVRPKAFVYLSSSGVFSGSDGSPDLTDTDLPTAQGPYSAAKRAGENIVPGALAGVCETHILRLGYLYGPAETTRPTRQNVSQLLDWIGAARYGRPIRLAANDPCRDWTWVPDLPRAILRILDGPGRSAPVHLCQPQPVHDSELVRLIAGHFPGTQIVTTGVVPTKAPMRPSTIPALNGFRWTGIAEGLDVLCTQKVAA